MIPKISINAIDHATDPIAFILGSYLTSGLGVVRNLGKKGITTVVLASNKNQLSFFSKYATGIICPHPKNNEIRYIDFLLEIGETYSFQQIETNLRNYYLDQHSM